MISQDTRTMAGIQLNNNVWEFVEWNDDIRAAKVSTDTDVGTASLKNRKKREQKKKKLESCRRARSQNKVTFGTVEEILFSREISYDAIPSRGAYPLGLGDLESRGNIREVDAYCAEQQQNLRHRSASFENTTSSSSSSENRIPEVQQGAELDVEVLESRQYDYKQGRRNTLFEPTSEEERLVILRSFISASGMKKSHITTEGDTAACNVGNAHPHPIADLNRDLRNIRATRDTTGCNCKALKADKLSVIKMKTELSTHGYLVGICGKTAIDNLSKTELVSAVKDVLKLCVLCTENNCECVQLGVPCSAEVGFQIEFFVSFIFVFDDSLSTKFLIPKKVCGCLKHGKKCGNPEGMSIFDSAIVREYRRNILTDLAAENQLRNPSIEAK